MELKELNQTITKLRQLAKTLPSDDREVIEASISQLVLVKAALKSIRETPTEEPVNVSVSEFKNTDKNIVRNGSNDFSNKVYNTSKSSPWELALAIAETTEQGSVSNGR